MLAITQTTVISKITRARVPTIEAARDWLAEQGEILCMEEDADHPGYWDALVHYGGASSDVFSIEPVGV